MRKLRGMQFLWLGAWSLACIPFAGRAQVFKCTATNGSVSYQDSACMPGQKQKVIDMPGNAPPGYVPPPAATIAAAGTDERPPAPPAYISPPAPLPSMYMCVGAVNGKQYLTRSPPPPYLAPLGVMGYPPQSLSHAYGSRGGAGVSGPELSRTRVGGPPAAAGMTEVQDECLPATRAQVCNVVRDEYERNHRRFRMAMPHEQPPLEQREQALQDQLRNCR